MTSSKIDAIVILVGNIKQIHQISLYLGFRPSISALLRLYIEVILSALFAASIDELTDMVTSPETIGIIPFKATEGISNAALSYRIGYIAKEYILSPSKFNRRKVRRESFKVLKKNIGAINNQLKTNHSNEPPKNITENGQDLAENFPSNETEK